MKFCFVLWMKNFEHRFLGYQTLKLVKSVNLSARKTKLSVMLHKISQRFGDDRKAQDEFAKISDQTQKPL